MLFRSPSTMSLSGAKIIVDGSQYKGGANNILLFEVKHRSTTPPKESEIEIIGFEEKGFKASVVQEKANKVYLRIVARPDKYDGYIAKAWVKKL